MNHLKRKITSIRPAAPEDTKAVLDLLQSARDFMHSHGNPNQWNGVYPDITDVEDYLSKGQLYVGTCEDGLVHMVFALCLGKDPTYDYIEDGQWLDDCPYGTIHMLASDGTVLHAFEECINYCKNVISNIRIDTHKDNSVLINNAHKMGFIRCGVIYTHGSAREAFQKDFTE
ncbi:MAG: N-acetyltransferase [Parasporobacterium sp.]|nr:N-acetyltransferase [Parasporobacterium sp.]